MSTAIDARVKDFVADLEKLVRAAALAAVQAALGGAPAPAKRKPGRPPKSAVPVAKPAAPAKSAAPAKAAPAKAASKAAAPAKAGAKRKKGQKRTAAELAALQTKLDGFVRANEGKRIEEISKQIGIATGELTGPMKKLIEAGNVRSTGSRRATRYYSAKKK